MSDPSPTTYLRRYTNLPALLHILRSRTITLLDPKSWDDQNDSYYMALYKEKKSLKSVLALCFASVPETYHHWHVFSGGSAGVCIVFDRKALIEAVSSRMGTTCREVRYLTIASAREHKFRIAELPFLKRVGYKPEGEFRVLYESKRHDHPALEIPIKLSSIRSVSMSPWLNANLSESTVNAVRSINGCGRLAISRSTLISNEQWKAFGEAAT
jgi:hypothetical protein